MKLKKVEPVASNGGRGQSKVAKVSVWSSGRIGFTLAALSLLGLKAGKAFEIYEDETEGQYFLLAGLGDLKITCNKKAGNAYTQNIGIARSILKGEKKKEFLVAGKPTAHAGKIYYALIPKPTV